MAKIKKSTQEKINLVLKEKKLLELINNYLGENELGDLQVEHIMLSQKSLHGLGPKPDCGPFKKATEYCTPSGKCKWVCE
jgi:hypothetical protein